MRIESKKAGKRASGHIAFRYRPLSPAIARSLAPDRGLIALMTIIIISAMILAVGISAALIGQSEIILSGQTDREYAARNIAASCAEEGLQRLKKDEAYTGGTVPIGDETCTVVVAGGGATRTITATASSDIFTKSIVISASLRQNAAGNAKAWHVDSWTEADPP